jgi:hypothetical protein
MARRRKAKASKRVKSTDLKRPCSSGKRPYAQPGEARAAYPGANVYRCPDCKKWHTADPVRRRARQARGRRAA